MNVDKKTQISKTKRNKRTISAELVIDLSDNLREIQTSSSQFLTPGNKPILFYVITSTAHLIPDFKSNQANVIYRHIGGVFNHQTLDITDHFQAKFRKTKFNVVEWPKLQEQTHSF